MTTLDKCEIGVIYQVNNITIEDSIRFHLQRLGLTKGNRVTVVQRDAKSAIISVQKTRVALEVALLQKIEVGEVTSHNEWLSLDQLTVGETGKVVNLYGQGAVRRRLMDMGVTKNVTITVQKLAPLGDPIEVKLRGYALTLRKEEAAHILMERVDEA